RESAGILRRLFAREYPSTDGFFSEPVSEVEPELRILLMEALSVLELYDDPDPGVYDPPPTKDVMLRALYAKRACAWEAALAQQGKTEAASTNKKPEPSGSDASGKEGSVPDQVVMSAEDRGSSALNLLFLLAQTYYRILELVISSSQFFCAADVELNESYFWTISNLKNLLANHEDLKDFPGTFEPLFPDLYTSTIVDVDWQDMAAPDAEQFLSKVQRYVRSKGCQWPDRSSLAWGFVELFRPGAEEAVKHAEAYAARMRRETQKVFGPKTTTGETAVPERGNTLNSAFISYSWDDDAHREWVRKLAERLRADGVNASIDRWAMVPGDQLPAFMERTIRENQFVIIVCTPRYKRRSDAREGGVGYEGDIMTAEVLTSQNHRKFIPVLRTGEWRTTAPTWLAGKYYINLSGDPYSERDYEDLLRTLLGVREVAPPLGKPFATMKSRVTEATPRSSSSPEFEDIKIMRVIVEDITEPRDDGTHGSTLYSIPFALSAGPPLEWEQLFLENWDHPRSFTTMHRPGIASISRATVILNGTTLEEVERYHRDTLQLAVTETNRQYRDRLREQQQSRAREDAALDERRKHIEEVSKRIKFD
ncbi:MAG TPA: toll/interleukin-1 receptor domain-containing protein, partial [Terriglobales bacterium]|nr:toll/interleukin-1 receptor domain-containing protein [Terriglobales bacterium]